MENEKDKIDWFKLLLLEKLQALLNFTVLVKFVIIYQIGAYNAKTRYHL